MIIWIVLGYLIGSVPFGVIVAKAMGLGNLREIGSGNIGATNVLRTGSKKAAALTLILDASKGAVAVLLARMFVEETVVPLVALAALVGHCYPVWLKFNGGKGVATFLGIAWALYWPLGLLCCLTWLIVAGISRYSSLAGMLSGGFAPVFTTFLDYRVATVALMLMSLLIYWRHWENIKRLRAGTESKIGAKKV
jgi:glycerol-3-phosphate acyltransferase PlsY